MHRIARAPSCALVAGWLLLGAPAFAAEFYVAGSLGGSGGDGTASASSDVFGNVEGDDVDSSPAYGATLGLAFGIDEALPSIKQYEMPSWIVRTELEWLTGRDYEFITQGVGANDNFTTQFEAWTVMPNFSLEIPIREPVRWAFGRIPVLEPMSIYANLGLGVSSYDFHASDNNSDASDNGLNFAWQGGAGITYTLTDTTSFVLGWRYLALGDVEADLENINPEGDYELEVSSHEVVAGLRINFYAAPLKDMHPRHWRMPRGPGWWPSWLGGPDDDDESDADDL